MKNIVFSLFLIFVLFDNGIFNLLKITNSTSWTVFFTLLLFFAIMMFTFFLPKKVNLTKEDGRILIAIFLVILIGLLGNVTHDYVNSHILIASDIIDFMKFPFCFVALRALHIDKIFAKAYIKLGQFIIKPLIIVIFICGVISQFKDIGMNNNEREWLGIHAYSFIFSHPTYFVACCVFILALITSFNSKRMIVYESMVVISALLGLRTKGTVIIAVFILLQFCGNYFSRHKFLSLSSLIFVITLVSWGKVKEYLSFSESARESAYLSSFDILKHNFPIGSGFCTFGSFLSGKANSMLYGIYRIPQGFDEYGTPTARLGDTGYPYYIAQFGLVGFILFVYIFFCIYKALTIRKFALSSILIYIYLIFALTSESALLNYGVEAAIVLTTVNYIESNY